MSRMTVAQRFWSKVDKRGPDDCWEWQAGISPNGYGSFWDGAKNVRSHRYSYEERCGPIPEGLVIDHLCRNPLCVNPDHLEPVTDRENVLRGVGPTAQNARKTHCKRGHLLSEENVYRPTDGFRRCRICEQARHAARPPRKR